MEISKKTVTAVSCLDEEELSHECQQLLLSFPKGEIGNRPLCQYQGFWYSPDLFKPIISFQRHFQAQDTDIIIATRPKAGTTWLKALTFAVTNRTLYKNDSQNHPLLTCNPHKLVPFFEADLYANHPRPDLTKMGTPRLFSTHLAYTSLPKSIKNSDCRIVYICRNPFDTFISFFQFYSSLFDSAKKFSADEYFDKVCEGVQPFGPFYEHVLEYWKESLERPHKVLFLKYEDLKEDIVSQLKKLANFMGVPFSVEEEKEGVIEEITKLCSFENLRDLEVNKTGEFASAYLTFENKHFFRKGQVGDWVNYFTPSMVERFDKLMQEKLGGSGLTFKVSL